MNTTSTAHSSIIRIVIICTIIIFGLMFAIKAGNIKVNDVTIKLSNNSELNAMTSKTKVSDILKENHILVLEDETVVPDLEQELGESRTIKIVKNTDEIENIAEVSNENTEEILNKILDNYGIITEKIVVEQIEIPFGTVTKDISTDNSNKQNKVLQEGQNGLKEVTYKIKYQDEIEIEKVLLSEVIIKEPIDKIVQISSMQLSSRSGTSRTTTAVSGTVAEYQAYAKERCYAYGWSDSDFNSLVKLWNRESGWRVTAGNKSSGAYGIPQALPASKMASYGSDYLTNYKTQINWGLNYIKSRYGTPTKAWNSFQSKGWY